MCFHFLSLKVADCLLKNVVTSSTVSNSYISFVQVYLVAENVIKIFVEGGLEASLYALGTEVLCQSR